MQKEDLFITTEDLAGFTCVHLKGELAEADVSVTADTVRDLLEKGAKRVLLDFGDLKYMSSLAIGMLLALLRRCEEQQVRFALSGLNDDLRQLFAATMLDRIFEVVHTAEDWQEQLTVVAFHSRPSPRESSPPPSSS